MGKQHNPRAKMFQAIKAMSEREPSITERDVGDIFWEVAHRIDEELPWVKLDPELEAELRLGGKDLCVLELHGGVVPVNYVALGRVVEAPEGWEGWEHTNGEVIVVELLRCTEVSGERLDILARHARQRTKQSITSAVLTGREPVLEGRKLQIRNGVVTEARVVLL